MFVTLEANNFFICKHVMFSFGSNVDTNDIERYTSTCLGSNLAGRLKQNILGRKQKKKGFSGSLSSVFCLPKIPKRYFLFSQKVVSII
jgi:hypothetical protein